MTFGQVGQERRARMKHAIALVDANPTHRKSVVEALSPLYAVTAYDNGANALAGMHVSKVKVVLVGQKVGASSGISFIKDLKKDSFIADTPIIFIADSEDSRTFDSLRDLGVRIHLVKPYAVSALTGLISRSINRGVEHVWQDLPVAERKALEETLKAFNSVAEDLANGNPVSMDNVNDSCGALVEVIGRDDLGSLLSKIKDHDNLTYVHSLRFAALMALFGKAIGLPKPQQIMVASGGLLHDIGMMSIPKGLLQKDGPLNPNEWKAVKNHVELGRKILAATDAVPKGVQMIVTQHHERLDGSGYPLGLQGAELNELARMAAIIDVFCALTDRRPYRRTFAPHVALETMATQMKNQLDMDLLFKFKDILLNSTIESEPQGRVA